MSTGTGAALLELVAVMDRLRTECPWDAKQTHQSLAPFLLEETYEALDALDSGDQAALCEELGDVLLQVLFHARVAAERTDGTGFTIDDVAAGIAAKLVRRHPHVFADVTVSGADEVKLNWDAIKAAERQQSGDGRVSALDGVPLGQPALSLADQLQRRAERAGVPRQLAELPAGAAADPGWRQAGPEGDLGREQAGPEGDLGREQAGPEGDPVRGQAGPEADLGRERQAVSDIGAELFALVARAREAGLDAELELRHAARVYRDRVHRWERSAPG